MELKPVTQVVVGFVVLFAVGIGLHLFLRWAREVSRIEPRPAPSASVTASDPRIAAAIIALAEDNVKLRAAHTACDKRASEWERRARENGE